jgi:DNA-binding response OmpR family regulator
MKIEILIAENDKTIQITLKSLCKSWNYNVIITDNGNDAWGILQELNTPHIAIIDRIIPGMNGIDICKEIRNMKTNVPKYIILFSTLNSKKHIIEGFEAGADDYIARPFLSDELRLRIKAGERIVKLQTSLTDNINRLEDALTHIKTLQGILPVCCICHRIRNDQESWQRIEKYLGEHTNIQLSHTFCPDCAKKHYPDYYS